MTRPASQATAGYFPTPEHLLPAIGSLVALEREPYHRPLFLDPCAGTGTAVTHSLIEPTRPDDRGGALRDIEPDFAAIIAPGLHLAFVDRQRITPHWAHDHGRGRRAGHLGLRAWRVPRPEGARVSSTCSECSD